MKPIIFVALMAVLSLVAPAHSQNSLNTEWLKNDLANFTALARLAPIERRTIDKLEREYLEANFPDGVSKGFKSRPQEFGFGYRTFEVNRPGGYCHVFVRGFLLDDEYVSFKAGATCSSEYWRRVKPVLLKRWKESAGPELFESEDGLFFERIFDDKLTKYKERVATALGRVDDRLEIPASLKLDYDALISPFRQPIVGKDGCGAGGVVPWGKGSVDALRKAGRPEILTNILRGYNPGGRVYALVALLELEASGTKIDRYTNETIQKVRRSEISIEACLGGQVYMKTAAEILKEFKID